MYAEKGQRDWYVQMNGKKLDGEPIKNTLDAFNNNPARLGLYDCNCDEKENGPNGKR
jgi:hypothetical protein